MKFPLSIAKELPIFSHAEEIERAIRSSQVVIVSGDTGSGKTTQLPKIALNAGRGKRGLIGCTQPRRLAAFTMAKRVASELNQELGGFVGCQHRFERILSTETRLKFMTDGILLAETRRDRLFKRYDTIIIDEAHERSLNIDFLLGILKSVLRKRRDLKVLISSATMDVERFSIFFDDAPVIKVPGRLYPIDLRWRAQRDGDDPDLPVQIANACDELICEGDGDILVFLPGEHDIRDAAETLRGRRLPNTEVIPLLASLPAAEQAKAFRVTQNRRIILSTNVAETSVTVPGIRYVVDSGLVRLSRYNHRTQVQRLLIESVSKASANQRMGRCGRVAPGVCIRLYAEDDFKKREAYTPPEILRTSLAGVILTMMDLNLGDISEFPFLEPPSSAIIKEGYRKLDLLGAIKPVQQSEDELAEWQLTHLGRRLPKLPVGPVLGAILFAAEHEKALRDTLIVAAALECDNPKRRPMDKRAEADRMHARFLSPTSDFSALLRLWRWYEDESGSGSQSRRRKLCKENFLSYPKMREWLDLHKQLRKICKELKLDVDSHVGGEVGMHRALLRGLVANIGKRDPETGDYQGTRGIRFSIFPGSGLAKLKEKKAGDDKKQFKHGSKQLSRDWVMTGDLVETSRLFARQTACISPEWIESIARRHCKFQYWAEHWDGRRGFVSVKERVTFWGVVIADGRNRDLSRIDPDAARQLFVREGLVLGDFPKPLPDFLKANLSRSGALLDAEAKTRRSGEFFDPEPAVRFYEERLPSHICNVPGLRNWMKKADSKTIESLVMREGDLPTAPELKNDFPDHITIKGSRFKLTYYFEQGAEDDGVTCEVPVALLSVAAQWPAEWLVPGMLDEKLLWMINVLPSKYRRVLQPINETITMCRSLMKPGQGRLIESFADALSKARSVRVPSDMWIRDDWPEHLKARYLVYSEKGKLLDTGRDIQKLLQKFGDEIAKPSAAPSGDQQWSMSGLTTWEFGHLPEEVDIGRSGWPVINYPALVDEGASVGLQLFADRSVALATHQKGVCRLFALSLGKAFKRYVQPPSLPRAAALYLTQLEQTGKQLGEELGVAALHQCFTEGQPAVRSKTEFETRLEGCYGSLHSIHTQRTRLVAAVLQGASDLEEVLGKLTLPQKTMEDLYEQLAWLVFPGFANSVPGAVLEYFPRYLEACRKRIERAQGNPDADLRKLRDLTPHWQRYTQFVVQEHPAHHDKELLSEYRWLVEEFRVSLFAQELRTAQPVSAKRLRKLWDSIFAE